MDEDMASDSDVSMNPCKALDKLELYDSLLREESSTYDELLPIPNAFHMDPDLDRFFQPYEVDCKLI